MIYYNSFLGFWYVISGATTSFNVSDGMRGVNRVHSNASWRWVDRPVLRYLVHFMTRKHPKYTYVAVMPLLLLYSVAMSILKFREGQFMQHRNSLGFHLWTFPLTGYFLLPDGRSASFYLRVECYMLLTFGHSVLPKYTLLWKDKHKDWLLPLYFVISVVWALEMYVSHFVDLWLLWKANRCLVQLTWKVRDLGF
jgi:hypothetical protein